VNGLTEVAQRTDEVTARARAELVSAVRRAAREGLTQAQIGQLIGRSQPEVSRLLHFHGTSHVARVLRAHAAEVRRIIADAGGREVRVFGSVATGRERPDSDIDLLFTPTRPLSLMELGRVESAAAEVLGVSVDLIPDTALRPDLRERVLAEAVPL
jgi:predicted nucleotidyltransferase